MTSVKEAREGWVTKNPNRVVSDDGETVVIEAIHRGAPVHVKVDKKDWDDGLYRYRWCIKNNGYAATNIRGDQRATMVNMHKMVLPSAPEVDHINGIRTDNRSCNLREVSRGQNRINSVSRNQAGRKSRYKGVQYMGYDPRARNKMWRTMLSKGMWHKRCGGYYETEEEAARAYDRIVRETRGAHGTYNFPLPGERSALREE